MLDPEGLWPDLDQFGLDGLAPATEGSWDSMYILTYYSESPPLRAQHTAGHSYYLLLDEHAWSGDLPGPPLVLAAHVHRNNGTALVEHSFHPMLPLAQRWLAERGADASALKVTSGVYARPTDLATEQAEERLRTPGRYEVLAHFTYDWEPSPGWTLALDRHQLDPEQPYRIFHRDVGPYALDRVGFLKPHPESACYTVAEYGFTSLREVEDWCRVADKGWAGRFPGWRDAPRSFDRVTIPAHDPAVPNRTARSTAAATRTTSSGIGDDPNQPHHPGDAHRRPTPRL
ncbi:hypothetical protein [Kitasatospora sp. NPDC127116]|uniref:hypothetical protein n=1 Tax=Kitasatospora sp. NPDC127116 TaxID=3345367 RepID=UPI003628A212